MITEPFLVETSSLQITAVKRQTTSGEACVPSTWPSAGLVQVSDVIRVTGSVPGERWAVTTRHNVKNGRMWPDQFEGISGEQQDCI